MENPYDGYNPENQLRPLVDIVDYYAMTDYDLCWLLLEPIDIVDHGEEIVEHAKRLSPGQKMLYFWWFLDGQVNNGGFVQFYYNGYGQYVPAIITGLEHIGDNKTADLVRNAENIYQSKKKEFDKPENSDLFESDLYDELYELSEYDDQYFENKRTIAILESYIRNHPEEFLRTEDGEMPRIDFSSDLSSYHDNRNLKKEITLKNGKLSGELKVYWDNGKLRSKEIYIAGVSTGEYWRWREDGTPLKSKEIYPEDTSFYIKRSYHTNGSLKNEGVFTADDNRAGYFTTWHENGQIETKVSYNRNGEATDLYLGYWPNGNKRFETDLSGTGRKDINYWDDSGVQLLTNGTGLFVNEYEWKIFKDATKFKEVINYADFVKQGEFLKYRNDVLVEKFNYQNDKKNGLQQEYDKETGKLIKEEVYQNGVLTSSKEF